MKRLDPATLPLENLDKVEEYLNQLLAYDISDSDSLEAWLIERGKFGEALAERINRNTIDFSCNTEDENAKARHEFDQQKLMPLIQRYRIKLDKRLYDSPYRSDLQDCYDSSARRTAAASRYIETRTSPSSRDEEVVNLLRVECEDDGHLEGRGKNTPADGSIP